MLPTSKVRVSRSEVEIARAHVGEKLRESAERILQPDVAADDASAEHLRLDVALERRARCP